MAMEQATSRLVLVAGFQSSMHAMQQVGVTVYSLVKKK
jgi:hypothetical protein